MDKRIWLEDATGHITHEKAAEISGVERSTYTKAVNGYAISIRTAKKIAKAFGFTWTKFFEDKCEDAEQSTA